MWGSLSTYIHFNVVAVVVEETTTNDIRFKLILGVVNIHTAHGSYIYRPCGTAVVDTMIIWVSCQAAEVAVFYSSLALVHSVDTDRIERGRHKIASGSCAVVTGLKNTSQDDLGIIISDKFCRSFESVDLL